jgi:hypothetical protein
MCGYAFQLYRNFSVCGEDGLKVKGSYLHNPTLFDPAEGRITKFGNMDSSSSNILKVQQLFILVLMAAIALV